MKARSLGTSLVVFLALALIAAGLAWRRNESTQRALTAAREENVRLAADLRRAEGLAEVATRKRTEVEATLEKARTPPLPMRAAPAPSVDVQTRMANQTRARLALKYGPLYRVLGFTAEQIARFEQQFIEHEVRGRDITEVENSMRGAWRPGDGPPPPRDLAITAMQEAEDKRHQGELAALLGESSYRQFQEFEGTEPRRRFVAQLAGELALTPTPLSGVQAKQLRQVLDDVNYASQETPEPNWDPILAQARTFLTDAQFAKLEAQSGHARAKATQEMRRLVGSSKK
jgi:hypothetical protein